MAKDNVSFNLMGLHQELDSEGSSWYFPFVGENQVSNHNHTPWSEELDAVSASMEISVDSGTISLSASQIQREILFVQPATRKFCFLVTGSNACKTQQESESLDAWRTALTQPQEKEITSIEVRYASDWEGPLQMVAGVYYSDETNDFRSTITRINEQGLDSTSANAIILDRSTDNTSEQKAVFSEISYEITDRLTVLGGIRYFEIENGQVGQTHTAFFSGPGSGTTAVNANSDDDGITLKANVSYDLSSDSLIYATYAEGFRTGGVNEPDFANDPARPKGYESDSLESYEVGIKSTALEGRLSYEFAAYFMQWDDMQTRRVLASSQFLGNSGSAEILGLEIGGKLLLGESWTIGSGLTFTEAELSEHDDATVANRGLKGDRIPFVPQVSGNIFAEYEWSLDSCACDAVLHGDVSYIGESFSALNSTSPIYREFGGYTLTNLRAVVTVSGKYTYSLFANNVLDQHGRISGYLDAARPDAIVATAPRTIGVEARFSF
jgi:iron complex outermembrane receptor protein